MIAALPCSNYRHRSSREAKWVVADLDLNGLPEGERLLRAANSIVCGVCKGAAARSRYGVPKKYVPLSDRPDVEGYARLQRDKVLESDRVRKEQTRAEEKRRAIARTDRLWDAVGTPQITEFHEEKSWSGDIRKSFQITSLGSQDWDRQQVDINDGQDYDDVIPPAYINIRNNGNMTVNQARALAKALESAADIVEKINTERLAQREGTK